MSPVEVDTMGKTRMPSTVLWSELKPWINEVESHDYRVRVVLALEGAGHLRVSVTLSRKGDDGRYREAYREGEVISSSASGGAEKAAIRALAKVLGRLDEQAHSEPPPYYVQLPLPLPGA